MFITKKRIWSALFIIIFGILQFNLLTEIAPVRADDTLVAQQSLLGEVGDRSYGNNQKDIKLIVVEIIRTALFFLGLVFIVLILVAGFKWMTSGGNEEKVKESVGQIKAAVIGLLIILAAWGITTYTIKVLDCVTDANGNCKSTAMSN